MGMSPPPRRAKSESDPIKNLLKRLRAYGTNLYRPRLLDYWQAGRRVYTSPEPIFSRLASGDRANFAAYAEEFRSLRAGLSVRAGSSEDLGRIPMAMTSEEALLLYSLVRSRRPLRVIETGVAQGVSTYFLLHALRRNGAGSLLSFDVSRSAGLLLSAEERSDWQLADLDPRRVRTEFKARIQREATVDLFIHDSDHSYRYQWFEYSTMFPHMAPGSLLTSDDVDGSFAFLDFCNRRGLESYFLVSPTKVFGIAEVGGSTHETNG